MFLTQGSKFCLNLADYYPSSRSWGIVFYSGTKPSVAEFNAEISNFIGADGNIKQSQYNSWAESKGAVRLGFVPITPSLKVDQLSFGHNSERRFRFSENTGSWKFENQGEASWFALQCIQTGSFTGSALATNLFYVYQGTLGLISGDQSEDLLIKSLTVDSDYVPILNDIIVRED